MDEKCEMDVITMRGKGISFQSPVNSGEAGGHRSKPEVVLALIKDYKINALLAQQRETYPCRPLQLSSC